LRRVDEDALTAATIALAGQYGRSGYRRVTALLNQAGWPVGKDRVQRIWRREGLKVPQQQRPQDVCGSPTVLACGSGQNGHGMSGATISWLLSPTTGAS
jgi:hypothetical protein